MEIAVILVVVLLVGLAIGTAAGWFFRSREVTQAYEQAMQAGRQRDAALGELRDETSRRATFEALAAGIPEMNREIEARSMSIAQLQRTMLDVSREKEALAATIEAERKGFEQKLKLLEDAKAALSDAFTALSANALKSNSEEFLKLAHTSVAPVREALSKFEAKVQALEVAREGAYQGLVQQVSQLLDTGRQLRSETSNLVQALRSPVIRGQWGEIQLRRVVEMAGMLSYCDFVEQETVRTETGSLRPDLVVKLPAGKTIVVDAKAPVAQFLDAMAVADDAERKTKLQAFARLVRERIAELGRKSYWDQFDHTPELVVMFLPGDHFYSAALQEDPALLEYGVEQKVLVATPVNLIGLLRAIAYGWRQEAIAENAKEISELGAELYKRISDLGGHWIDLGRNLTRTVDAYNSAVGSLESRVLVSARRFRELGAASAAAEIAAVEPVEKAPRSLKVLDISTAALKSGTDASQESA
ncbi:MAG TPA: DNA recombination protein RmuC [Burkholderiales bacterium]|nr:DNA recombination protein RmuC [Burkholderiales bacterium]